MEKEKKVLERTKSWHACRVSLLGSKEASVKTYAAGVVIILISLFVGSAPAQTIYSLTSPYAQESGEFGSSVSGAGDVNNDNYPDVIVGAAGEDAGAAGAGRAYVFSGATGDTLFTLVSPNPADCGEFGSSVSGAGDVNNDNYDDVIVGAYCEDGGAIRSGRAYVFSGNGGGLLYSLVSPNPEANGYFGFSVSGAGRVNDNDTNDDVIVGAYKEDGGAYWAGRAYVFSGATGDTLFTMVSPNPQSYGYFGHAVSGIGNVNPSEDAYHDLIVGANQEDGGATDAGRAYILSGKDGSLIHTLVSQNVQEWGNFGRSVSGAGDVNNDNRPDVIVGAYFEDRPYAASAGRAYVFSGATGGPLCTLESPNLEPGAWFGWSVSGAGDVNNDMYDDVVVGAWYEDGGALDAGRAYIFDGNGGDLLCTLISPNAEEDGNFGRSVSGAGYIDSDTLADVIVGADMEYGGALDAGRAYVFSLAFPLSGNLSGGELVLEWAEWPGAAAYLVHGADNQGYFVPDGGNQLAVVLSGTTTWSSSTGIGDPDHNWTYLVIAVDSDDEELHRSNRFGEFDFDLP